MGQLILINEGLQKGNVIGEKADEQSHTASNSRGCSLVAQINNSFFSYRRAKLCSCWDSQIQEPFALSGYSTRQ